MHHPTELFEQTVLPLFEEYRQDWLLVARATAFQLGEFLAEVCIDDVREIVPPPPDKDPRVNGAVFERKYWLKLRTERSRRRACHNRPIAIWRLKSREPSHCRLTH